MISRWKKIRYRFEWTGVFLLSRVIPLLPRRALLGLARFLGWAAYRLDYRGRRNARENLRAVYGSEKSEKEIRRITLCSFRSFAQTVLDQFWTVRLTKDNYLNFCEVEVEDQEALEATRSTGAIWVTPHYGNFEWVSIVAGFNGFRFTVVGQEFHNPLLTEFFKKNREHTGHILIPQRRSLLRLLKSLQRGGHAAFLTDLNIPPGRAATIIKSMGFLTCVTALHAELERKTKVPVIPGICVPQANGTYLVRGLAPLRIGPEATAHDIAQQCWDVFEPYIREHPEHWLWMYRHWRYHIPEHGESYPGYSNPDGRFHQLALECGVAPPVEATGRDGPGDAADQSQEATSSQPL